MKSGERAAMALATGFGLGLSPVASGTAGTLLGLPIAALLVWYVPIWGQLLVALALAAAAIPVCDIAEKHFGRKDDGRIVADEYLTFPICTLGLPPEPWMFAVAFVTNRFFDVVKPPPARALQRLNGGLGVVIDDVFAACYSLAANHMIYWMAKRLLM